MVENNPMQKWHFHFSSDSYNLQTGLFFRDWGTEHQFEVGILVWSRTNIFCFHFFFIPLSKLEMKFAFKFCPMLFIRTYEWILIIYVAIAPHLQCDLIPVTGLQMPNHPSYFAMVTTKLLAFILLFCLLRPYISRVYLTINDQISTNQFKLLKRRWSPMLRTDQRLCCSELGTILWPWLQNIYSKNINLKGDNS